MTRFSLILGLTVGAMCTSLAAPGLAQTLRCKIEPTRQTGEYIPLSTQITYDTGKNEATVAFLDNGKLRTIDGRIETVNKKRITFVFENKGLSNSTNQYVTSMMYRATFMFGSHAFRVNATPLGYSNLFKGKGACAES